MYGLLAPDVPLGPFEGTALRMWAAHGRRAKLHASPSCSYLRSAQATEREARLEASTIALMCGQCATYDTWTQPGTGLGIFVGALTGLGLLYELDSYHSPEEDSPSTEEIEQAASVLDSDARDQHDAETADEGGEDTAEEEAWDALQEARQVREDVAREWANALASLQHVHQVVQMFPWLAPWAEAKVQRKRRRLEVLRAHGARLVNHEALALAAAIWAAAPPALPAQDPAFAPLGGPDRAKAQLTSLWRRWRDTVADGWDGPRQADYLLHHLTTGMGSRRKGRDQMLARARALLHVWAEDADVLAKDGRGERTLIARIPASPNSPRGLSPLEKLSRWEQGVLLAYTVAPQQEEPASPLLTLRVPGLVAERLLSQQASLSYQDKGHAEPATVTAPVGPAPVTEYGIRPGIFDDTPVHRRRLVTAGHLRALRDTVRDPEQLYVVLGAQSGVEVMPLSILERRCSQGWEGVILAGATDLPDALFADLIDAAAAGGPREGSVWPDQVHDPSDEAFGRALSMAEGERVLTRLRDGHRDVGHALRSLALARSVADLRDLDSEVFDDRGYTRRPFPPDVWHGLLAMEQLDLEPFESGPDTGRPHGSQLPLGILATVQAYTTDAAGRYQGRAHSPGCRHQRPRYEVSHDDEMVTIDALMGNEHFDPCSKCGGYAVRRLTEIQVAYYRAAHRLHDVAQHVSSAARYPTRDTEDLKKTLTQLSELAPHTVRAWFPSPTHARQWHKVVHRLHATLTGDNPA